METTPLTPVYDRGSGRRLKQAMADGGVTVSALSSMTGLSDRTITALRSGRSAGNMATWRAIGRALRRDVTELVGE